MGGHYKISGSRCSEVPSLVIKLLEIAVMSELRTCAVFTCCPHFISSFSPPFLFLLPHSHHPVWPTLVTRPLSSLPLQGSPVFDLYIRCHEVCTYSYIVLELQRLFCSQVFVCLHSAHRSPAAVAVSKAICRGLTWRPPLLPAVV